MPPFRRVGPCAGAFGLSWGSRASPYKRSDRGGKSRSHFKDDIGAKVVRSSEFIRAVVTPHIPSPCDATGSGEGRHRFVSPWLEPGDVKDRPWWKRWLRLGFDWPLSIRRMRLPGVRIHAISRTHDHVLLRFWRRHGSRPGSASSQDRIRSVEVWENQLGVFVPRFDLERAED